MYYHSFPKAWALTIAFNSLAEAPIKSDKLDPASQFLCQAIQRRKLFRKKHTVKRDNSGLARTFHKINYALVGITFERVTQEIECFKVQLKESNPLEDKSLLCKCRSKLTFQCLFHDYCVPPSMRYFFNLIWRRSGGTLFHLLSLWFIIRFV